MSELESFRNNLKRLLKKNFRKHQNIVKPLLQTIENEKRFLKRLDIWTNEEFLIVCNLLKEMEYEIDPGSEDFNINKYFEK